MPDIFDMAQAAEQRERDLLLKMRNRGPQAAATGRCLNCGEQVPEPRRWCDADCRDDWQGSRSRH